MLRRYPDYSTPWDNRTQLFCTTFNVTIPPLIFSRTCIGMSRKCFFVFFSKIVKMDLCRFGKQVVDYDICNAIYHIGNWILDFFFENYPVNTVEILFLLNSTFDWDTASHARIYKLIFCNLHCVCNICELDATILAIKKRRYK